MKTLKAAVIGCGRIAHGYDADPKCKEILTHINAYKNVRGVELVAVCDKDFTKAQEVAAVRKINHSYSNYVEMLTREDVDMVSVCTPPSSHAAIVKDIARRGLVKAIFCEKPMAESKAQALGMIDACKEAGIFLQIAHLRRFDKMHQQIRTKIQANAWGRIQAANFYYSGGVRNTGSHMFDLLRFYFGEAHWVQAHESANPSGRPGDPNIDGFVQFKGGLLASFQALDHTKFLIFEMDCIFEHARVVIKRSGLAADFYKAVDSSMFKGYRELVQATAPFKTQYQRSEMVGAVNELVATIRTGHSSISTGTDGMEAMVLIDASLKSAHTRGKKVWVS